MTAERDSDVAAQVKAVRRHVGAWVRNDHTFLRFTGKDAAAWLHTQTTNDVRAPALFEADAEDTDDRAIGLLEEAALLSPTFEDAYEALGVILHRHGRVDEAIRSMQVLARLNPDCVMAHTNLSVFYAAKGLIDEAATAHQPPAG